MQVESLFTNLADFVTTAKSSWVGNIVLSSTTLRSMLWIAIVAFVAISLISAERFARKLEGTRNNTAYGSNLHRKRIRQYAWRRMLAVFFSSIVPGLFLAATFLYPDIFLGAGNSAALTCASGIACSDFRLAIEFVLDQAMQGALFDVPEIFGFGFESYSIDLSSFVVKGLLSVYRAQMNLLGISYIYMLGSVLIDWLMLNHAVGVKDNGRRKYVNLSRLSRGGILSGYEDNEPDYDQFNSRANTGDRQ